MSKKNVNSRVCAKCKSVFNIIENDFIKKNGKFYEIECYKNMAWTKNMTEEAVNEVVEILLEATINERRKIEEIAKEEARKIIYSKNNEINRGKDRDLFVEYIKEAYEIVGVLPQKFYTLVAKANNGTYKNLSVGISYAELLDMFKRKRGYLERVYNKNLANGKSFTFYQRFAYDLAIICDKYDDYLNWKQKQKVLETVALKEVEDSKNKIDYSKIKEQKSNDDMDISSVLDDLY